MTWLDLKYKKNVILFLPICKHCKHCKLHSGTRGLAGIPPPKGSLEKATIDLFAKSGWKISVNGRSYFPDIDDPEISCSMCRAQEMSRYVENGTLDCGLTGKDWIMENDSDVVVVADLIYSKVSQRPARWVLAVPFDSPVKALPDLATG